MGTHRLITPLRSEGDGPLGEAVAVDPVAVLTVLRTVLFGQFSVQQTGFLHIIEPEGRPEILLHPGLGVSGGQGQLEEGFEVGVARFHAPSQAVELPNAAVVEAAAVHEGGQETLYLSGG